MTAQGLMNEENDTGWDYIRDLLRTPLFSAVVMEMLTDEGRQKFLWTMMLADGIVICFECRK